ncbi:SPOR domain-containing protein [Asticcacaulis sp.]|uniref:SPOR domain-containing protein n=1 Tax=Asticcacaulis sp. TaxID=1872648 RepID=UPI002C3D6A21|nr:SPOR domain-containing protein [Asticcacaulis sp.]HTM83164.1 SPOR domain-containing protein [Asticcacaulis sp.]
MSDKDRGDSGDRGTYSPPTEDNLSYESRRAPVSRDKAPVTLIISGICLVVLLLVVVIAYNYGMNKHGKVAPEVGDSLGDIKEGQVQDAQPLSDQDLSDSGIATFAPGSEVPGARPAASASTVDIAPLPAAPIEGPLPSQSSTSAIVSSTPPARIDATPVPGASASASPPAVAKPAAPVAAKPVTAPVVATKPAANGSASVQIGAYTSTDIANAEYAKVASSYGLFVGGASKRIEKVTTPNGTFYRTAFTGLSADKAKSFCSALKASGHDCIVK